MVDLSKLKCRVFDLGIFTEVGNRLGRDFGEVEYFVPWAEAFPKAVKSLIGEGFENMKRIKYFWENLDSVDMIAVPDTHCHDLVNFLREKGYPVAGVGDSEEVELDRVLGRKLQKQVGLPVQDTKVIKGIANLEKYLKTAKKCVIKLSIFRGDVECVDEQTEIFTNSGWKYFKDLKGIDTVLTMNMKTRDSFFVKTASIYSSWYEGDMYKIDTRKVDMLVTPKHKFFARYSKRGQFKYKSITDLTKNLNKKQSGFSIPTTFKWTGKSQKYHVVKEAIKYNNRHDGNRKIDMNLWLQFIAWFISEGCLTVKGKDKNKYCVTISQSKIKNYNKWLGIKNLLDKLPYNYQTETNAGFSIYDKSLFEELHNCYNSSTCGVCGKQHCSHNKKVPIYIKGLSTQQIKIFLDTYVKGDGSIDRGNVKFYSSSKQITEDLQELVLKTGKGCSIRFRAKRSHVRNGKTFVDRAEGGVVSILKTDANIKKENVKIVNYKGFIYDVTVEPYHNILVRRNKKICWTGNTWAQDDFEDSEPKIARLKIEWGPKGEELDFVVEELIDGTEPGLDGVLYHGEMLSPTLLGYEKKGCGYIAKVVKYENVPKSLKDVNDKFAPIYKELDYNFWNSTEVIVTKKREGFLIDPCNRLAAPCTNAVQQELISNYSEIWYGMATGEKVIPKYKARYGGGAAFYSQFVEEGNWARVLFDKKDRDWIKFRETAKIGGHYWAVPKASTVCSIVAIANSVDDVIGQIQERSKSVKAVGSNLDKSSADFTDIKEELAESSKYGIEF